MSQCPLFPSLKDIMHPQLNLQKWPSKQSHAIFGEDKLATNPDPFN